MCAAPGARRALSDAQRLRGLSRAWLPLTELRTEIPASNPAGGFGVTSSPVSTRVCTPRGKAPCLANVLREK